VPQALRAARHARRFAEYSAPKRERSPAPADGEAPKHPRLRRIGQFVGDLAARPQKRKRRRRRLSLIVLVILSLLLAMILLGSVFTPGQRAFSPALASGATGYVSGIPYADAFNATAALGIDPRLVAAVAWVESGFRPEVVDCTVVSSSVPPAKGIMQLKPVVFQQFGVDPCVPERAIEGGARYLLQLHEQFGTWDLAISAYNIGPGALEEAGRVPPNPQYVRDVQGKWNEYMAQFPSIGGIAAVLGACPWRADGSTEPVPAGNNTVATQVMANTLIACFGRNGHPVWCYDPRSANPLYEHPRGRACDFMMSSGTATGHEYARGQAMAEFAAAHASELHIIYVIWFRRVWYPSDGLIPWEQWRPYTGPIPHVDHVHVSVHLQPGDPPLAHCVPDIACTE
jgi:soluble lytic murein transglycosylase-like protein